MEDYCDYVLEDLYEQGQELLDWVDNEFEKRGI